MRALRLIGFVFVALGLTLAALAGWLALSGQDMTQAAGQLWYALDSASLNTFQSVVQRYVHPALWDDVIISLLLRPAWATSVFLVFLTIVIGVVLVLLSRSRGQRRRRRKMMSRGL
jgi:uncharacterized membrane protein